MGLTAQWILARGGSFPASIGIELEEALDGGWRRALLPELVDEGDLIRLVREILSEGSTATLVIEVVDSDLALLAGAAAGLEPFELLINEGAAVAYELPVSDQARESGLAGLSAWVERCAPENPRLPALRQVIERDWVFAEEGVTELGALIGLDLGFPERLE